MRERNQQGEIPASLMLPVEMTRLWQESVLRQIEFLYQVNERALASLSLFPEVEERDTARANSREPRRAGNGSVRGRRRPRAGKSRH